MSRLTDGELRDLIVDYTPRPALMGRCQLLVSNGDATVVEALEELRRLRRTQTDRRTKQQGS